MGCYLDLSKRTDNETFFINFTLRRELIGERVKSQLNAQVPFPCPWVIKMGTCRLVQHLLNLNKLEASCLIHGLQSKNDLSKKEFDSGAFKEKKLEHVIEEDLEAHLLL